MNYEFRLEENCPTDWNQNLLKSEFGNIFNTFEYGQYAQSRLNWKPLFLSIIGSNGNIVSETLIFEITNRKLPSFLKSLSRNKFSKFKWIYGPVIISEQIHEIINAFLNFLSKTKNQLDGSLHPLLTIDQISVDLPLQYWNTFLIDLQQNKESIFNNMDKKSVRKNIERSQNRGVKIYEISDKSINDYHDLLNQHRMANNNSPYDLKDTKELWDLLKPIGFNGFIAKKDDEVVGGIMFSSFNGFINEWGIARSTIDFTEKLYSQDLLKWKIIEWGINNNQKFYDLSGVNPNPSSSKDKGIMQYKKKWGGKQIQYLTIKS